MSIDNWKQINGRWKRLRVTPRWRSRRHHVDLATGVVDPTEMVVDVTHMMACFEECRANGGQAPGPDGLRYSDFGRQELSRALEAVRSAILRKTYVAPASRTVPIPKQGGFRKLALDNIVHRVLGSAVESIVTPVVTPHLSPISHSACGRGVHTLLRTLYWAVESGKYGFLVNHDVKAAFPSLSINVAMLAFGVYVKDRNLLWLIDLLLRGAEGKTKHIGIPQGLALSPLALEASMSLFFDRFWPTNSDSLVAVRYVDNLVFLTATKNEGRQAVDRCRLLLQRIGLSLKDLPEEEHLCDLHGDKSELLGFSLSITHGKLRFDLAPTALDSLQSNLMKAHRTPNPPSTSRNMVTGWLNAMSPAFDYTSVPSLIEQVVHVARRNGFRELSPEFIRSTWESAGRKWKHFVQCRPRTWVAGPPCPRE